MSPCTIRVSVYTGSAWTPCKEELYDDSSFWFFECGLTGSNFNIWPVGCGVLAIKELSLWTEPLAAVDIPEDPTACTDAALTLTTWATPSTWSPSYYDDTKYIDQPEYTVCGDPYTDLSYEFYE